MPQVHITVIGDAPTPQQKAALFEKVTDLMVNVLKRSRNLTVVSVTTAAPGDWSVGGAVRNSGGVVGVQAVLKVLTGTGSDDQKARMIEQLTEVLRSVLGNPTMPLYAVFEEIPPTLWGYDGRPVSAIMPAHAAS